MRKRSICFVFLVVTGCSNHQPRHPASAHSPNPVSAVPPALSQPVYQPVLSDMMSSILVHHAQLAAAGKSKSWNTALAELKVIRSRFDEAAHARTSKQGIDNLPLIYPYLDSLSGAVMQHNERLFQQRMHLLTTACNRCHQSAGVSTRVPE